ncbi:carbohydrate kinase [Domibacillus sp. A3M-37]|uniref:carbohydrate kinase family protein n=1 Tax=Domibacillus sp. A3M-37 TaxID=2962037 RepID=UPI0020B82D63|nr:carbohydrate kinase [Domibacillus sp. A3M-37]MCP3763770.1 carbohydrate kinase [Domibacillus sp. A3M-37]
MKKVFCMGEALIDFIPAQKNKSLKNVEGFERVAGGAPMNVAITVSKYSGHSVMLTKLANDHFGDYLMDVLQENGVDTSYITRSSKGETGLAFVSVDQDGERSFSFYRKNAADLLIFPQEIKADWFNEGDFLHFCSVNLVKDSMKETHKKAIKEIRKKGGIISFDPNVRLPLWPNAEACQETIRRFIPLADIVKVSDEELSFITEIDDEKKAIQSLFIGCVKTVVYTRGKDGAVLYLKSGERYEDKGYKVVVVDTTGAGDAFIGGFLSELSFLNVSQDNLCAKINENHQYLLAFSNASGALTASVKGAIQSAPTKHDVLTFITSQRKIISLPG